MTYPHKGLKVLRNNLFHNEVNQGAGVDHRLSSYKCGHSLARVDFGGQKFNTLRTRDTSRLRYELVSESNQRNNHERAQCETRSLLQYRD